jgi:3-deoxy-7-phosphoheptulonate synthase
MGFNYQHEIPSARGMRAEVPMEAGLAALKASRDDEIRQCLASETDKFIVIVGPCSAHEEAAICDYVGRLAAMQEKVSDRLIIIPRIYTNKPRTTGSGYKGMLHQPDPTARPNMVEGIRRIRRMHLRALRESGLPAADEMLYPGNYAYVDDLLSYVAIGARSTENQQHRLTASGFSVPAGFKNPMSGDLQVMLNSVDAAQSGHIFSYNNWQVETDGNPFAHAILRGAFNQHGNHIPNYHYENLCRTADLYEARDLENPAVIVDTNHSNSAKDYREQPRIAMEILHNRKHSPRIHKLVKGMMIESFIVEGAQEATGTEYGKSITDPCLGWDETRELLLQIAEKA